MEGQADKPTLSQMEFFKARIEGHDKVSEIELLSEPGMPRGQVYRLHRTGSLQPINIYLTNLYTAGEADLMEMASKVGNLDCIVTMSNWNQYTTDARRFALSKKIGLFDMSEFMGALNFAAVWKYIKKDNDSWSNTRRK